MSVHRKLVKTPVGIVEYVWLEGGLVPYEVLREDWVSQAQEPPPNKPKQELPGDSQRI